MSFLTNEQKNENKIVRKAVVIINMKKDKSNRKISTMIAIEKIQEAFKGEAERLGLKDEEDVVKMIKEFRKSKNDD